MKKLILILILLSPLFLLMNTVSASGGPPMTVNLINYQTCKSGTCSAWSYFTMINIGMYVTYANGTVYNIAPVTTSSVSVPSSQAITLISVRVTNTSSLQTYVTTLVPPSGATSVNIYLIPTPYVVYSTITITDLTGKFPAGTKWYLYPGNAGTASIVIASGYTDATDSFSVAVLQGTYTIQLVSGTNVYSAVLSLGPQTPNPQLQITYISANNQGVETAVTYGASWSNGVLVMAYQDATGSTSQVTFTLFKYNSTGIWQLAQTTVNAPSGCITPNCLGSAAVQLAVGSPSQNLYVQIQASSSQFGTFTLGPFAVEGQQVLPPFTVDPNLFGLADILPLQNAWSTLLSLFVIVTLAGIFGALSGWVAAIIASAFATLFSAVGWLGVRQITLPASVLLLLVAVIGYMNYRKRKIPF